MTDGLLQLRLACDRQGRTRLVERKQRYPLTTTAVLPLDAGPGALIYVQNAAGSVFGGDRLHLDVALGDGAELCLSTPSATRLQGDTLSVQTSHISVGKGAFLESIPDMLIPHARSMHRQDTLVELASDGRAIIADALAPGRVASGERHAYQLLALRLRVCVEGSSILHDAATFCPDEADPWLEGALGRQGYVGTLFALTQEGCAAELADRVHAGIASVQGVYGGASPLASGYGVVARLLADDSPLLRHAMQLTWDLMRRCLLGRPAPQLRK